MYVSVIIPTYKDVRALELILEAFNYQTYKKFEVIVAEDDNSEEVKSFLKNFKSNYEIQHFSHEDIGSTTKPIAVNRAVKMSRGEYLIYIDGDTIPYSTFVDGHVSLSERKTALCGRRVNLGKVMSQEIREGKLSTLELEKKYFRFLPALLKDHARHIEQGIYLKPNSYIQDFLSAKNKNLHLLGSNFSCYKNDMIEINGSDEDMPPGAGTDDVDIEWRLQAIGVQIKSCKNSANLFHLYHKRNDNREERTLKNKEIIREKQLHNNYQCKNGIYKL